jgi:N-acyl-D-aspartate/D-glutamate deacylase
MTYDLVIRDAKVVDGSGTPAYAADVAVQGGRIAEIGRVSDDARRTINADGRVVAPGFIDHHTHLDAQLLWDSSALPSPEHGVTTVITGNCGLSLMPAKPGDGSALIGTFVRVEGIPRHILETVEWRWSTVAEYFGALEPGLGVNVASMIGHNALRQYVMSDDATEREATPEEIEAMKDLLRQGIADGAMGYTINRNLGHFRDDGKPLPSRMASDEEMLGLASVLSEFNTAIVQHSNMGAHTLDDIDWFARLGRASGRPVLWSSINWLAKRPDFHREQFEYVDRYFREGLRLYGNTNIHLGRIKDEAAIAEIICHPYTNVGMSDAGAHVDRTGSQGIATELLGYWVREKGRVSLEQAVNVLTFKVASIFGFKDRGLVWRDWAADLVVFDPDTIGAEESVKVGDYPGGFERLVQHASGVDYTIINGEVLIEHGEHTGARSGRVIRNSWAEAHAVAAHP